jgi:hypothetical protein
MHSLIFYGKLTTLCPAVASIPTQRSVADLRTTLLNTFPVLNNEPFLLATAGKMLQADDSLIGNEDISIMPPFSGG